MLSAFRRQVCAQKEEDQAVILVSRSPEAEQKQETVESFD